MSFETGRQAIMTYWAANWTATAYGKPGHAFTPAYGTIRLTIKNGAVRQYSLNRLNIYIGTLTATIYTEGGQGDRAANLLIDPILDLFHGKTLDAAGALVTSGAQTPLVRFSPPELGQQCHPYVGAQFDDPPFQLTNVICPYIRYEVR